MLCTKSRNGHLTGVSGLVMKGAPRIVTLAQSSATARKCWQPGLNATKQQERKLTRRRRDFVRLRRVKTEQDSARKGAN